MAGLVAKDLFVVLDQVAEDFDENAAPVEQHRRRIHRKERRKETGGDVARVHLVHARVKRHPEKTNTYRSSRMITHTHFVSTRRFSCAFFIHAQGIL